jgi:hypothetical protein
VERGNEEESKKSSACVRDVIMLLEALVSQKGKCESNHRPAGIRARARTCSVNSTVLSSFHQNLNTLSGK